MNTLVDSMVVNGDGLISFDAFCLGLQSVSQKLTKVSSQSTPSNETSNPYHEVIYENVPTNGEKEEAWVNAINKIDPQQHLSSNSEVRGMWMELYAKDHALLELFEMFLMSVIGELDKSQSDIKSVQCKIKRLLSEHNKEVHEMDGLLQEQLMEAYQKQEIKSMEVTEKISTKYQELLNEREELIANLSEKEQTLRDVLHEKTKTEQELRKERLELLNLNESLQHQLDDSYKQLTASQKQVQRLSRNMLIDPDELPWLHNGEPLVESSITSTTSYNLPTSRSSMSPSPDFTPTSPHAVAAIPPQVFPYYSLSLAEEVQEALRKEAATPTNHTPSPTTPPDNAPTPTTEDELVSLIKKNKKKNIPDRLMKTHYSVSSPTQVPAVVSEDNNFPIQTPVHLSVDHQPSFTVSQLIPPREHLLSSHTTSSGAPSRVFKIVILGDSGVGKTSLVRRLTTGAFTIPRSTLGLDYTTSIINIGDEKIMFQLWDTAGQERFHSTTAVYFRRADAFIIVYDVCNRNTFKSIKTWISLVKTTLRTELPVVMFIGNKNDCSNRHREITREEGQCLALEFRALFSETSALSGDNVVQAHVTLATLLLERENNDIDAIRRSALRLNTNSEEKRKCKC
jgi:small GTP-binding protein